MIVRVYLPYVISLLGQCVHIMNRENYSLTYYHHSLSMTYVVPARSVVTKHNLGAGYTGEHIRSTIEVPGQDNTLYQSIIVVITS